MNILIPNYFHFSIPQASVRSCDLYIVDTDHVIQHEGHLTLRQGQQVELLAFNSDEEEDRTRDLAPGQTQPQQQPTQLVLVRVLTNGSTETSESGPGSAGVARTSQVQEEGWVPMATLRPLAPPSMTQGQCLNIWS